jgi:hypothetical protein
MQVNDSGRAEPAGPETQWMAPNLRRSVVRVVGAAH